MTGLPRPARAWSLERIGACAVLGTGLLLTLLVAWNELVLTGPWAGVVGRVALLLGLETVTREGVDRAFLALTVCLALLVAVNGFARARTEPSRRLRFGLLLAVALASMAVAVLQHCLLRERYLDVGDTFHYFLGPKYYAELGYQNHYVCAAVAQQELGHALPTWVRDLSSNATRRGADLVTPAAAEACRARFGADRWESFRRDVETFRGWHSEPGWERRFHDHGFNGTPVLAAFAGALANRFDLTHASLTLLSLVQLVLIVAALACVVLAFGWPLGLAFCAFFWLNFPDRFLLGGAYLRYAWVAALLTGLALLKWRRPAAAGSLVALSAGLTIFPLLFLAGIAFKALAALSRGEAISIFRRRYLTGAALTLGVLAAASVSYGDGVGNWSRFLDQMQLESGRLASGRIGFVYNFIHPKEVDVDEPQLDYEPRAENARRARLLYFSADNLRVVLSVLAIFLILRRGERLDDLAFSILLGFALFFLCFSTVRYYYAGMLGLPLLWHARPRVGAAFFLGLLMLTLAAYAASPWTAYCFAYNTVLSAGLSLYLAGLLVWLETGADEPAVGTAGSARRKASAMASSP